MTIQPCSRLNSDHSVPERATCRRPWRVWAAWSAPAIATLALLSLVVAGRSGGIVATARWPEQQAIFLELNTVFAALPASLWVVITLLGDTTVLILLLALFLCGRPQAWAAVLASVPAGGMFSVLVKHWASVPRPATVLDHSVFNLIGPALFNNSFPSGHTITAFAATAAVLMTLAPSPRRGREWLLLAAGLLLASIVALSRIAVGAHWPLDIVAGAAGGWLAGLTGVALARHAGWWQWLFLGTGRRATGAGLVVLGLLLWLQPHNTMACASVLGLAGLCGFGVGLWLVQTGRGTQSLNDQPAPSRIDRSRSR